MGKTRKAKDVAHVPKPTVADVSNNLESIIHGVSLIAVEGHEADKRGVLNAYRVLEKVAIAFQAIEPGLNRVLAEFGPRPGLSLSRLLPRPKDATHESLWKKCCATPEPSAHRIAVYIVSSMLRVAIAAIAEFRVPRDQTMDFLGELVAGRSGLFDGRRYVLAAQPYANIVAAGGTALADAIRAEREGTAYTWPSATDDWVPMKTKDLCELVGVQDPRTLRCRIKTGVVNAKLADDTGKLYLVDPAEIAKHSVRKDAMQ